MQAELEPFMNNTSKDNYKQMRISVCIPTYKRQALLRALLDSLEQQQFDPDHCPEWDVVIIDNDSEKSAYKLFEEQHKKNILRLRYVHEPRQGLAFVRNTAIDSVINDADFLCFIDDDETACERWLEELIKIQKLTSAECVRGPVLRCFKMPPPLWVSKSGFFKGVTLVDGQETALIGMGNLLISCAFLKRTGLRFDERFNTTGGEDEFFFYQARHKFGLKLFGASNAIATEHVTLDRIDLAWMLKRKFRIGSTLSKTEIFGGASFGKRLIRFTKSWIRIALGTSYWIAGLALGKHIRAKGLCMIAFGLGILAGFCGISYNAYKGNNNVPS